MPYRRDTTVYKILVMVYASKVVLLTILYVGMIVCHVVLGEIKVISFMLFNEL